MIQGKVINITITANDSPDNREDVDVYAICIEADHVKNDYKAKLEQLVEESSPEKPIYLLIKTKLDDLDDADRRDLLNNLKELCQIRRVVTALPISIE